MNCHQIALQSFNRHRGLVHVFTVTFLRVRRLLGKQVLSRTSLAASPKVLSEIRRAPYFVPCEAKYLYSYSNPELQVYISRAICVDFALTK